MYKCIRLASSVVVYNDKKEIIPLRLDLYGHSPDGFEWGYEGSGPAQLALAILADYSGDGAFALHYYQEFKRRLIANLDKNINTVIITEHMIIKTMQGILKEN